MMYRIVATHKKIVANIQKDSLMQQYNDLEQQGEQVL